MRLSIISTMAGYAWGGSEELWYATAVEALQENMEVMATVALHNQPAHDKIEWLHHNGGSVHFVSPSLTRIQRLTARFGLAKYGWDEALTRVTAFRPDVILVSLGGAACLARVPELANFLQNTNVDYHLIVQYASEIPDVMCIKHQQLIGPAYAKAKTVGFVSNRNRDRLQDWLGFDLANAKLVRNPVNLSCPELLPFQPEDDLQLACVARLDCHFKAQDILIHVLSSEEWKTRKWTLNFYGDGPHRDFLHHLAGRRGIAERCHFAGHVTNIKEVWRDNHALVLPSRSEGMPLALVEAMLCGRAALVTDVAGMTELVDDEINGFVANGPDTRSVHECLSRLWHRRHQLDEMGRAAFETATEIYDAHPGRTMLALINNER
ncbi:glycosyltransferase [Pseudomonadota bacterium]